MRVVLAVDFSLKEGLVTRRSFAFMVTILAFFFLAILPVSASAQSNSISFGYGFGALSNHNIGGRIEEGNYNFVNLAYQYERHLNQALGLVVEPFVSHTMDPKDGIDAGATVSLKYGFHRRESDGFYISLGGGSAYTSINFKEQGTHLLFIIQGGVGYKWKNFFVENKFKHYSNGGTAVPNRSINSDIIMVGIYF